MVDNRAFSKKIRCVAMRFILIFLSLLVMVFPSKSEGIKLLKKNIRTDNYYTDFYPFKDYLVVRTDYRKDMYITVIDNKFNSKTTFFMEGTYSIDIQQIRDKILALTIRKDFYCLYEVYPVKKKIFCYDRGFVDNLMEFVRLGGIAKQFITEDGNVGLLKIPREAYDLHEILFTGRFKFKGRFVKVSPDKKIILKKDFNTDYKSMIYTKYGLYALKDKNLIFIDLDGKEKIIKRDVKAVNTSRFNIIHIETEKGDRFYIYENNLYKIPQNCRLHNLNLFCEDKTVINIKNGDIVCSLYSSF